MLKRREANRDALKRTFAAHNFAQLLSDLKEKPYHHPPVAPYDDETLELITEVAWDDWNFGSGHPLVLKLYEYLIDERDNRNKWKKK